MIINRCSFDNIIDSIEYIIYSIDYNMHSNSGGGDDPGRAVRLAAPHCEYWNEVILILF